MTNLLLTNGKNKNLVDSFKQLVIKKVNKIPLYIRIIKNLMLQK